MLLKMQPRLPQYSLTPSLQALQRTSYGYSDYGSYTAAHYSPSTTSSSTSSAYHQCSGGAHCSMTSAESFSYYEDDGGIHTPSNSNTEEPNSPHVSLSNFLHSRHFSLFNHIYFHQSLTHCNLLFSSINTIGFHFLSTSGSQQ